MLNQTLKDAKRMLGGEKRKKHEEYAICTKMVKSVPNLPNIILGNQV
jgi:hypothetical protein